MLFFKDDVIIKVKLFQGESDFITWQRRISKQIKNFGFWEYVESTIFALALGIDEEQDTFIERYKVYNIEFNKTMHLLENAIYDDMFSTFWNHGYNFTNSNPKVLIDTLTSVLIRATTGSV